MNTDVSAENSLLSQTAYCKQSLDECFIDWFSNEGGHYCSAVAYLLAQLYKNEGYETVVYSYGFSGVSPPAISHATTLVKVKGVWYMQDGYFDLESEENGCHSPPRLRRVCNELFPLRPR